MSYKYVREVKQGALQWQSRWSHAPDGYQLPASLGLDVCTRRRTGVASLELCARRSMAPLAANLSKPGGPRRLLESQGCRLYCDR